MLRSKTNSTHVRSTMTVVRLFAKYSIKHEQFFPIVDSARICGAEYFTLFTKVRV